MEHQHWKWRRSTQVGRLNTYAEFNMVSIVPSVGIEIVGRAVVQSIARAQVTANQNTDSHCACRNGSPCDGPNQWRFL